MMEEGGRGWNRCLPTSVYGTHRRLVSSTRSRGSKGASEWLGGGGGGRGVCDIEETSVEWMRRGFCPG